jgi:hypothetical protein
VSAPPSANAAASPAPRPRTEKLDPADFKNDPLIKEALEIFRGQIVEVRR